MFTIISSAVCIFCNKTLNGNNKTRRCNNSKQVSVRHSEGNSVFGEVSSKTYSIFWGGRGREGGGRLFEFEWEWEGGGWGGRLFEAGCLLLDVSALIQDGR